jgi:hypothetical protein
MKELYRSNDIMTLTYIKDALEQDGIDVLLFDEHASVIEGSITAIQRRIMVMDEEYEQACRILGELEIAQ